MNIKKYESFILSFTIANALFWSLFPHSIHCEFLKIVTNAVGIKNMACPEHKIHILMGILFFGASIWIAQRDSKQL